jgi:hypothetical protein
VTSELKKILRRTRAGNKVESWVVEDRLGNNGRFLLFVVWHFLKLHYIPISAGLDVSEE